MNSQKIKYKNKWYYVDEEDLYEPSITKLFVYKDPDLTKLIKTPARETFMIKKSDLKDELKEWGGAGFSYGGGRSAFSVNRGGFGGVNNIGGPNMMYTYEIKPLNRTLQPKVQNRQEVSEPIRVGAEIQGKELNKRDGKQHKGILLRSVETEKGTVSYYVILCDETQKTMKIDPTTAVRLSGERYIDPINMKHRDFRDKPDLSRAGQYGGGIKENYIIKAKFVKESLNEEN
jgi:hypothetical protein